MDKQMEEKASDKVVSLFSKKTEKTNSAAEKEPAMSAEEVFLSVMRKNEENRRRLAEDRLKSNKSVLRSYRIKN